jgi:hypothetical protein
MGGGSRHTSNNDFDIYEVKNINGVYSTPERLDENINSNDMDLGAFIDPEENYIIFSSARPGGYGSTDLYISSKEMDGTWKSAINMGEPVNSSGSEGSPFVSADGLYLFFNSDRIQQFDRNPYWVDAQVIYNLITDVENDDPNPADFYLSQNYPNPFNPITKINFQIPQISIVIIKVYNVLGKEVATLMAEEMTAGNYETTFNALNLSSGIYYYQLTVGNYSLTKKMVIIK